MLEVQQLRKSINKNVQILKILECKKVPKLLKSTEKVKKCQ